MNDYAVVRVGPNDTGGLDWRGPDVIGAVVRGVPSIEDGLRVMLDIEGWELMAVTSSGIGPTHRHTFFLRREQSAGSAQP